MTSVQHPQRKKRRSLAIGDKVERLTVIGEAIRNGTSYFRLMRCDCGVEKVIRCDLVNAGKVKSCGCFNREATARRFIKHGHSTTQNGGHSTEYGTWNAMIRRCHNPNDKAYPTYGGRGITVCDRWRDFQNFLADMGKRPNGLTLERRDNDLGYGPDNCVWASRSDQQNNRRVTRRVNFQGQTVSLARAIAMAGISANAVKYRLYGKAMSAQEALDDVLRIAA